MPLDPSTIPGVTVPTVGTLATHNETGIVYRVVTIERANFTGTIYAFYCNTVDNATGTIARGFQVWYDDNTASWKCGKYIPVRYRDDDGVKKDL